MGREPLKLKLPLGLVLFVAGVFDILAKLIGKNIPITAYRIKEFNTSTCHGSQKVRDLGFVQSITTEEGLNRMVDWYVKKGRFNRERCSTGPRA